MRSKASTPANRAKQGQALFRPTRHRPEPPTPPKQCLPPASEGGILNTRLQPREGPGAKGPLSAVARREDPSSLHRKPRMARPNSGSEIQTARRVLVPRKRTSALPEHGLAASCVSRFTQGRSGAGPGAGQWCGGGAVVRGPAGEKAELGWLGRERLPGQVPLLLRAVTGDFSRSPNPDRPAARAKRSGDQIASLNWVSKLAAH